ncbi:MAG: precorrin-6y C5,15-methyltransferase (decarboxylating) subunit CbiE [Mariprofundaceae bacterium]|nr:precorrin-6y C5,15-methyltransferase (decarboxylating) subunit CbiE [Mariprofundaceae bacterium]
MMKKGNSVPLCGYAKNKATILGVLDNGILGLSAEHLDMLQQADVVIGGTRVLELFSTEFKTDVETFDLTGHLKDVPPLIEQALGNQQAVVVLATGDPLCHGIANYLKKKIGLSKLNIMPNVSALQLACARVGVSWQDAYICSVHTQDAGEWVDNPSKEHGLYSLFKACVQHRKIITFTSPKNNPARISRMLVAENMADDFDMIVTENLLQDNERIVADIPVSELAKQDFSDLNMVILERKESITKSTLFGLEDASFNQRKPEKGLITKRDVRAVSLAHMQLKANSIVWDIGAGSGSVGLEAARLCANGWIYAIEKNEGDFDIAKSNQLQMDIHHYTLVHAKAPECLEAWPNPDAVFIGGSGGKLGDLIKLIVARLNDGGHLVMNFVTIENLTAAVETLKTMDVSWQITQMQVSRSKPILHMHRMAAENPVWIVTVEKMYDVTTMDQ